MYQFSDFSLIHIVAFLILYPIYEVYPRLKSLYISLPKMQYSLNKKIKNINKNYLFMDISNREIRINIT